MDKHTFAEKLDNVALLIGCFIYVVDTRGLGFAINCVLEDIEWKKASSK